MNNLSVDLPDERINREISAGDVNRHPLTITDWTRTDKEVSDDRVAEVIADRRIRGVERQVNLNGLIADLHIRHSDQRARLTNRRQRIRDGRRELRDVERDAPLLVAIVSADVGA